MAGRQVAVLTSIRQLFHTGSMAGLDDGELLERFATWNDESAFAALVALHGPMVLGVCRRILRDGHDVEDAFQATFLVLVQRAGSIRDSGRLGPWLHGVARRVAMRARAEAGRRRSRQDPVGPPTIAEEPAVRPASRAEGDDVLDVIDEEVARLPARYREAVVLCDLEGRSYAEAARRLSCPLGTLQSRLARGRARLRTRLVSRGVAPLALTAILGDVARAAVPEALADATVRAATAGAVSATAAALAGSVARSLIMSAVKNVAGAFMLASIAIGAGLLGRGSLSAEPQGPPPQPAVAPEAPPRPPAQQRLQPEPQPPRADGALKLEVVDGDDHSALPGASVWARADRGWAHTAQGTTDEEGRYTIAISAGPAPFLQVVVAHPGFAPIELRWDGEGPIPDSYTLAMDRGVPIGGTVRDDRGRPIAGARVHLQVGATPPRGGRERYPDLGADIAAAVTDNQGRWRSEALPASARPGVRLELVTTHPDHVGLKQTVTAEALRALAADGVMKTGRSLSGTVLSPTGRPVAGASVFIQSRSNRPAPRRVQTDREGRFRTGPFIDPSWGEFTMVVRADGFASFAQVLLVPAEVPPQLVRLSPRRPLHGRVVDAQGRPVPGAVVRSATEFGYAGLDWDVETGADGRFVWFEAPATGSYMLDVVKPPFRQIIAFMVPGGSDDLTLTLHRPQRIHGTVTDAETGRAIERLVVISGSGPIRTGWPPDWTWDSPHPFGGGKYDLTRSGIEQQMVRSIRIEAEGYEPAEFLGFADSLEDVEHDFRLRKVAPLAGVIHGLDGQPLAGVDVMFNGSGYNASIENGRLNPHSGRNPAPRIRTGPDGRYTFRPQGQRVSVIAVHDSGFAFRSADDLAASTDLTLARWGRIEGVVKIGQKPASGQTMAGWLLESPVHYKTETDESGRFVLDRVAPGRLTLYRRVENQDGQGWTPSDTVSLDMKPGATAHIEIGGTGRPVVGRLAIPAGVKLSHFGLGNGALKPEMGEPPTPDDFLVFDSERRAAWWAAFSRTPEGRACVEDRERSYAVALRPDGTFRAEDIPAGRYVLKLPFEGLSRGTREGRQAFARSEVVVPAMPGGRSDEPLDIGAIPLEVFPFHEPNVGDLAPTFAAKAPDGRPLDLAAHRGKFVLLHFWSGRPEDAAIIPHLKAVHDAFGRDPRFVMIGWIADETPGPVRRYGARHGLSWEQRFIGSTYAPNPFEAAFGVWFPPLAFLIGPDGRILAKDLQGQAIEPAVARALQRQPKPQGAAEPPRIERMLKLEVVDGTDRSPLAGAAVLVLVTRGQAHTSQGATDEEGRFSIPLAGDTTYFLYVVVAHPGFAPIELRWDGSSIPGAYTLAMERGSTIGGVVRDEQGRPIAGVRVFAEVTSMARARPERYASMGAEIAGVLTDAEGRWRSEALPATAGAGTRLDVRFMHPDYSTIVHRLRADEARARSHVQIMKRGASVAGTVRSPTGRPVAGASVVVTGSNDSGSFQPLKTDEQGRFQAGHFIASNWPSVILTVQAEGFASAMRRITVAAEIPPQVITLAPRKPLRGQVVDSHGRAIAGAAVAATKGFRNGDFDWEAQTDADGRFVWFEAPATGSILLDAYKAPFVQALARQVDAGSDEVTITLHRPQHLHGTVIDATTGRPIERFTLVKGWGPNHPGDRPEWLHGNPNNRTFTGGRYDIPDGLFPDQGQHRSIRIEADGYEPGEFLGFLDNVEDIAHDFKLRRAAPLTGIVRGPDGHPLAGADVALSNADNDARIQNGQLVANRVVGEALHTKTGPDGRFRFQPQAKPVSVLAVHDAGFAVRSPEELAASPDITLARWGRIEGIMKIGNKPAARQRAAAWLRNQGFRGRVDYDTPTDESGRFVFERVTPGRMEVYRYVDDADHRGWTASNPANVDVKPGETVRVQVGGTGRLVVGRLALPAGAAIADFLLAHGGHLATEPSDARPDDFFDWSDEQQSAWWDAFRKTPEGRAYFDNTEREYALDLHPDGTFRIEDVPAGRYVLKLPFNGRTEGDRAGRRAFARVDVVVADLPGGHSDEPLDVGVIPLEVFAFRELGPGERVPAITAGAADGRPLDLAALRGKFVLLAFWAAQGRGTAADVAALKATYDAFGRDPRFVMIGLSQDVTPEVARRYAARHEMVWEQRYLGSLYDPNPIPAAFGVRFPPAILLIGPDGRIIARDLRGDAIQQTVSRALR